jgi:VanZ family protein
LQLPPIETSILGAQNKPAPRFGLPPETRRALILGLWAVLVCCVIIGSLLPAASPVMVGIGPLHVNDKVMHFGACLALSLLPVIRFRDRRRGIVVGLSMFVLGILMEAGQQFSPGRAVELGDVLANGAGVSCGTLLGLPIRTLIAIL